MIKRYGIDPIKNNKTIRRRNINKSERLKKILLIYIFVNEILECD